MNSLDSTQKLAYKPIEVSTMLGLGRTRVYELIREKRLRAIAIGKRLIIPKDSIVEFLRGETGDERR